MEGVFLRLYRACTGCGLLDGVLLPGAGSGQPALLVARLLVAGAATTLLAAVVAVLQPDPRPLWASLAVLGVYAVVLLGGLWMLTGLMGLG